MSIRAMKPDDLDSIYQSGVEEDGFAVSYQSRFWPKDTLKNWIEHGDDVLLVAEENERIIGYLMTMGNIHNKSAILTNIYVDPHSRRRGIGKKLIDECLKRLRERTITYVYAQVKKDNTLTQRFFQTLGFTKGYDFLWMETAISEDQ